MITRLVFLASCLIGLVLVSSCGESAVQTEEPVVSVESETGIPIGYLEIVTPEVEATCALLSKVHGVAFSEPEPMLGQARTAGLRGGGRIGVRAPLRPDEDPVVRPYLLVDDIAAALEAAGDAGAEIALPAMAVEGQGTFAIYILGGIEHALWQN